MQKKAAAAARYVSKIQLPSKPRSSYTGAAKMCPPLSHMERNFKCLDPIEGTCGATPAAWQVVRLTVTISASEGGQSACRLPSPNHHPPSQGLSPPRPPGKNAPSGTSHCCPVCGAEKPHAGPPESPALAGSSWAYSSLGSVGLSTQSCSWGHGSLVSGSGT